MTTGRKYRYEYEPIQFVPCRGIAAAYRHSDGSTELIPLVAMAVCRTVFVNYHDGQELSRERQRNTICGVHADDEGFHIAEESQNFAGYLGPGEDPPPEWGEVSWPRGQG